MHVKESVGIFAKHDHSEKIRLWSKNRIRGICSKRLRTVYLFVDLWLDCGSPACPHLSIWKLQTGPLAYSHHLPQSQCWRQGSHSWHWVRHHSYCYTLLQEDVTHRLSKDFNSPPGLWHTAILTLCFRGSPVCGRTFRSCTSGIQWTQQSSKVDSKQKSDCTEISDEAGKVFLIVGVVLRVLVHISWVSCASIYQVTQLGTIIPLHSVNLTSITCCCHGDFKRWLNELCKDCWYRP